MSPFHKYINHLFHDAERYAKKAVKGFDEEDIHKMRVEVKKIKAAFHFLQFFDADLKNNELKKLKKIFAGAGELRELQLLEEAIKKFRSLQNKSAKELLLHYLHEEENKAKKKFDHQFQKAGKEALDNLHKVMLHEKEIDVSDYILYFQSIVRSIIGQMQNTSLTTEEYHELRKKLKELKYNLSFADEQSKKIVEETFSEKELSGLEELVGKWHDQVIIVLRLKEISERKMDLQSFILTVTRRTQHRCDLLLKKISNQLMKKVSGIKNDANIVLK